jgi:fructuronate reductase
VDRLDAHALSRLPSGVARPRYPIDTLATGIVHLGIGAFHRAHQAIYTDDAIANAGGNWGICGVSLRSPDVRDRLVPQDCLYTAVEKSPAGVRRRVVGSVREVLFQETQYADIRRRLAARETQVVSLTVTEKGYCHEPATGRLDMGHLQIVRDLAQPDSARTVPGLLAAALAERRRTHGRPLTVLCCDNLPQNGALVCGLVVAFASQHDAALADWIGREVAFPSTMIDRIVPATTAADIAENDAALGFADAAPVVHEPFAQWVIEDRFTGDRPAWDAVGALLVDDVDPYESMKLRLLNASHSAFAYLGFLAGFEFIYEVAARPSFVAWMRRFMADEVYSGARAAARHRPCRVRGRAGARFANPALPHRTRQVAMDGSQKLPQRILATVRDNLAANRPWSLRRSPSPGGCVTCMAKTSRAGRSTWPIRSHRSSPHSPRATAAIRGFANALLALRAIFDEDLGNEPRFAAPVTRWLSELFAHGAAQTVARATAQPRRPSNS